jgi:hypothetical protein
MTTLRAHFDGRVLIPDEPANLPVGRPLDLQISEAPENIPTNASPRIGMRNGFPIVVLPPNAKPITMEDIQSAEDEQ